MVDTSATGGYLLPAADPAPLEGEALNKFFQQFVVGITGMAGDRVRPALQSEPPVITQPANPTNWDQSGARWDESGAKWDPNGAWAAIRTSVVDSDEFPTVLHKPDGGDDAVGEDELQRHEEINILASFYDLGTNGLADKYSRLLRDGLAIPQNLYPLTLAGMGFRSIGSLVTVPSLLKERWLYRVDLPFAVARQVTRRYPVRNLASITGELVTSANIVLDIEA